MFICCTIGVEPFKHRSGHGKWHCPNCSAHTVYYIKSNPCFTFFCIPLIPCGASQKMYECQTCGWANANQPLN